MKILQVISSFPPAFSYGGALRVAYEISKELVHRGHDVTVYTTDVYDVNRRLDLSQNPTTMDGITIYRFKNINNNLAYNNFPIAPQMASYLNKNIKKYDIVHLQEYRSFQAILVHHYAKKYKVPFVIQPHASTPRSFQKKNLKLIFDTLYGKKIFRDASRIIAVSKEEANYDAKMVVNRDKIQVVYNGICYPQYISHGNEKLRIDMVSKEK
jgi:glycosyltransferase involved in cell wall biosynthesis